MGSIQLRLGLTFLLLIFPAAYAQTSDAALKLDSLRHQVAALSAEGKLDSALTLVKAAQPSISPSSGNLLEGKLQLKGVAARKALEAAAKDSLHGEAPRGEAIFRLGQLHYATGKYPLAIPQFRKYLTRYPKGPWRDPAAYWMAYACLQFAQGTPPHRSFLDTGLRYLTRLQSNRPRGYYFPLALTAKARLLLARGKEGDTTSALAALEEARRRMPPEEFASTLLLSAQASPLSNPDDIRLWEDSVLWEFPTSLEASYLVNRFPVHKTSLHAGLSPAKTSSSASPRYALLLGNFSVAKNAEEVRKSMAAKGIRVWVEQEASPGGQTFSVLHGIYPDSQSARKEGYRLFKPLSFPFQIIPLHP